MEQNIFLLVFAFLTALLIGAAALVTVTVLAVKSGDRVRIKYTMLSVLCVLAAAICGFSTSDEFVRSPQCLRFPSSIRCSLSSSASGRFPFSNGRRFFRNTSSGRISRTLPLTFFFRTGENRIRTCFSVGFGMTGLSKSRIFFPLFSLSSTSFCCVCKLPKEENFEKAKIRLHNKNQFKKSARGRSFRLVKNI